MRILTNICSDDLPKSRDFYVSLLGLKVNYESNWYIQLCSPTNSDLEYGIIQRNHALVPKEYQAIPTGMYVTFVVEDIEGIYNKALTMKVPILQTPRNEFYGQRRFLVKDPSGCLIDISSPLAN
ncbi:VOC family protein [Marinomonas sp. THO17]|uniref:VOC family protein n=1 Tax=Marinomonas sp. THO17 TaxID=3149048 RepID=UPI00336BF912